MTAHTELVEPETIRLARARLAEIERLISDAREAIDAATAEVETLRGKREAARGRGDHQALWAAEEAILEAEKTIADREKQIRRLMPEHAALPTLLAEHDRKVFEAKQLAEHVEGYERLNALNDGFRALAVRCEEYARWRANRTGAPMLEEYPWLREVRRLAGDGRPPGSDSYDWHLALAVRCLPDARQRLAELERSLRG